MDDDRGFSQPHKPTMEVVVWGARGSVPTPAADHVNVGGNTSCIEVRLAGGKTLIVDAGTGIRMLGLSLGRSKESAHNLHIFFTHFHWDHLQGLPYFDPLYSRENTITFHSTRSTEELHRVLSGQMAYPYYPVPFDRAGAAIKFEQIHEAAMRFGNAEIMSFAVHHPGGACGYRIDAGCARLVHVPDHEHGDLEADARLIDVARGADVLIYDAQFTPEEYGAHVGWGHSTWLEATRFANVAGVKQLVLFHHDPQHSDDDMQHIVEQARKHFPNTTLAVEGKSIAVD
jgi:phosphoribosyl 1,2-cyclic phosphodiesterase